MGLVVGKENCIVVVGHQRGIDVVLNDQSKWETTALISFNEKQHFMVTNASSSLTMSPKNIVAQIKCLPGQNFRDEDIQQDQFRFPFSVSE